MSPTPLAFLGGNGHCAARLTAAREALARRDVVVDDVAYPGFEGRPPAAHLDAFLDAAAARIGGAPVVYATGIGGLLVLCLRARGALRDRLLLLQAPVLWGLEHRRLPRLMRFSAARYAALAIFSTSPFQAWFVRRHFRRALDPAERRAFFDGYRECRAFTDLFAWLGPPLLRRLENAFAAQPDLLQKIEIWWGDHDHVVDLGELRRTEVGLGVRWPLQRFPDWGHYPMIDAPDAWAEAVARRIRERSHDPGSTV